MNSILSYPQRGPYGDNSWSGNTSGYPVRDLFKLYTPKHVVDPAEGSGTTRDVCKHMQISYEGFDLHSGFNLLQDSLKQRVVTRPDFVFFHPPYGDMITYSGKVWGQPHPDDLSRCKNTEDFIEKMQRALINIYDSLLSKGHYAVLIGDQRKNGEYRSFQADVINLNIGALKNVLIKVQHNERSNKKRYPASCVLIKHEYLLVFQKDISIAMLGINATKKLSKRFYGTWKNLVAHALNELGGKAALKDLYRYIGVPSDSSNLNIEAKIRQTLQRHFVRVGRGVYKLPS